MRKLTKTEKIDSIIYFFMSAIIIFPIHIFLCYKFKLKGVGMFVLIIALTFLIAPLIQWIQYKYREYQSKKKLLSDFRNNLSIGNEIVFKTYNDYGTEIYKYGVISQDYGNYMEILSKNIDKVATYYIFRREIFPIGYLDENSN